MILVLDLGSNSWQKWQRITGRAKMFIQGQDMLPMVTTGQDMLPMVTTFHLGGKIDCEDHMKQLKRTAKSPASTWVYLGVPTKVLDLREASQVQDVLNVPKMDKKDVFKMV